METLTLEKAKTLIGKELKTEYSGYKGQDGSDRFILGAIKNRLEIAEKTEVKGWENQKKYWESYMTKEQLDEMENTLVLITKEGRDTYIRCHLDKTYYFGGVATFTCSDADREVRYELP